MEESSSADILDISDKAPQGHQREIKHLWEMKVGDLTTGQKFMVREELFNGRCFVCPVPIRREELHVAVDIDHLIAKGQPGRNYLTNMRLAHHACNARRGQPTKPIAPHVSERENSPRTQEWSSEEGARSDKMTYRYRQRLFHPQTGLFRNAGQVYPKQWVADILEDLTGIGKSITYLRYLNADIAADYF